MPVRNGEAVVSFDKWIVFKVLNISLLSNDLEFNLNSYENLNNEVLSYFNKRPITVEITDMKTQTDYLKNVIIQKFHQIAPTKRIKRGILNPLGSMIKILTGNLDNEDAIMYEKLIDELKLSQTSVSNRITLVTEMVQSFVNVANSTHNNFIQLDKAIWELRRQFNNTKSVLHLQHVIFVYNLFFHNFQTFFIRLDELETAIAFSKLNTLHQSIIDSDELLKTLKNIEETSKLVYPVNLDNLIKLEQTIDLKAYFKENQITFILEIPLIQKGIYIYYQIFPLPITNELNQTSLIIPKFPYLLMKGLKAQSLSQPCKEIDEALYLCDENEISTVAGDKCVIELMEFTPNTTSCHPIQVQIDNVKIISIQPNNWILYSKKSSLLTRICKNEVSRHDVRGTYILTIDDECEVKVDKITLRRRMTQLKKIEFPVLPIINSPATLPASEKQNSKFDLEEIDLSNLQLLSFLVKKSESEVLSKDNESIINHKTISVGTLILYVIVLISILIVILYFYKLKGSDRNHQLEILPKDNFELKEGGVIHPHGTIAVHT